MTIYLYAFMPIPVLRMIVETLHVSYKPMLSHLIFRYKYATGIFALRENAEPERFRSTLRVEPTKGLRPFGNPTRTNERLLEYFYIKREE